MEFPRLDPVFNHAMGIDYETDRLEYWHPDFTVLGVGIATEDQSWFFDRHTPNLGTWLRDTLPGHLLVAHNAQYDLQCSRTFGVDVRACDWHCTMVTDCLIDEHQLTYNLADVASRSGVISEKRLWLERLMAALGVDTPAQALARLADAPPELVAGYGASDARDTLAIRGSQTRLLSMQELGHVYELEMALLPVLADMSWVGVRVDLQAAHDAIPVMDERELVLQGEINEITGGKFNVNSTPQIRAIFKPEPVNKFQYRLVDGTIVGATKGNKGPSIDAKALLSMQHPLAAKILALRKVIKLRDTFLRGHLIGSADANGFVHTSFNQTKNDADAGTGTGRLSSTGPALQQITKRDKENAALLRSMFLPDDVTRAWGCLDYSQVDFRCGAHLINDPNIIRAYWENPALDYHQIVSDMTGIPRNAPYAGAPYAKQMNLGMQFGAGAGKVCFMMGMPYEVKERKGKMVYLPGHEGKRVFELYHSKLPGVQGFAKHAEAVAKETGFVKTQIGRRLRFPGRRDCRKAAGLLFQAYAADLHKYGLVRTDALIRAEGLPARLSLSVHDEMGLSMVPDVEVLERIRRVYCDFNSDSAPIKMRVPITASGVLGDNWWEACKD